MSFFISLIFSILFSTSAQAGNLSSLIGAGGSNTCGGEFAIGTTVVSVGGGPFFCKKRAVYNSASAPYSIYSNVNDGFTCDSGGKICSNGACTAGATTNRRVFMTAQKWTATNVAGHVGADAKCQSAADAAFLGGTWKAFLSTSTRAANTTTSTTANYFRAVNPTLAIVSAGNDFATTVWSNSAGYDETGAVVLGNFWHSSDTSGNHDAANGCSDFAGAVGNGKVEPAGTTAIGGATTIACTSSNSLLCVEQ